MSSAFIEGMGQNNLKLCPSGLYMAPIQLYIQGKIVTLQFNSTTNRGLTP